MIPFQPLRMVLMFTIAIPLYSGFGADDTSAKELNRPCESRATTSAYAKWPKSILNDPDFFPIMVWTQNPVLAPQYKEMGVNTFMYIFAICMRNIPTNVTFTLYDDVAENASIEVIDEDRALNVEGNTFSDDFGGFDVHLYRITPKNG